MLLGGLVLGEAVICDIQYCFNNFILCVRCSRQFLSRLWKDGVNKNSSSFGEDFVEEALIEILQ